jgi:hypothetical protein
MTFDFDKAYAAFAASPSVQQWMTLNKDQLVALTETQILSLAATYVIQGDAPTAISAAMSLERQAAVMVENSADIAQRRYDAGQRLLGLGKLGLELLLAVLAAGVGL